MDTSVMDALNIFYKLKGRYDKEDEKIKNKIRNMDATTNEKRDLYQSQKRKCVNCKKPVGTIFKVESDKLTAICGATADDNETPCDLNIKIKKGNVINLPDYVRELKKQHAELVASIMKIKFNLLFKYVSEEDTVNEFEKEKDKFDKTASLYDLYKTKLITITTLLEKRERISITDLQLYEFIKEIKSYVEESKETSNPQMLKDVVELYINKLMDILKENREMKYSYQSIESTENGEFRLVQLPYTKHETDIVVGDDFKVEKLVLKK